MKKITELLFKMGIYPNLKCHNYIKRAVELDGKMTDVYAKIAEENNDTLNNVERSINHALEAASKTDTYKELFFTDKKICNHAFVSGLRVIISEMEESKNTGGDENGE